MINVLSDNNVCNGKVISKSDLEEMLEKDSSKIYEVIRVINKRPVFLREHFDRLSRSVELLKLDKKPDFKKFSESIELLIRENNFENCNVRVSYYMDGAGSVTLMYFIKSSYPAAEVYDTGVDTIIVKKHRSNPNAKFYEASLRDSIDRMLNETKAFEAVLVNDDNSVSEGSRSNVFFVDGDSLVTSPDGAVLLGVTRSKVIQVCEENGIKVIRRKIMVEELKDFEAAFITGTSNNVLPIRRLDDICYDSATNEVVRRVSKLYLNEMEKAYK